MMFKNILLQTALRQMAVLGLFVALGFMLAKCKVIPAGYGKDPSVAAGMVPVSPLLSVATIPLILTIFL